MTTATTTETRSPAGRLERRGGRDWYRIDAVDRMPPFLMSLVSESDVWTFVSSAGPLTAGRGSPERSLFPYETDDRLHFDSDRSGPVTILRIEPPGGDPVVWTPFGPGDRGGRRSLLKAVSGHALTIEERHATLPIVVRTTWSSCDAFGLVRAVEVELDAGAPAMRVSVLDGLRNVSPAGVEAQTQRRASTLVDAYKRTELVEGVPLAVFCLESAISDRPEPKESLRANVVWSAGPPADATLLGEDQIGAFVAGDRVRSERVRTGVRGAFLELRELDLTPGGPAGWRMAADADLSQDGVVALARRVERSGDAVAEIDAAVEAGAERLERLVHAADGSQRTADRASCAHHASSVLFNCMRGGVFGDGYEIGRDDLAAFLDARNAGLAADTRAFVESLPERLERRDLVRRAREHGDPDLVRLATSYLPVMFSRRHGDPSRPWNMFDIRVADERGRPLIRYEGNWRDIFQNWESLCLSFPRFLPSVVALFVNGTSCEGFNPYRVTSDGFEWEVPDPDDPWSNIGYWGDHQIVYLLKLLEWLRAHEPSALDHLLLSREFAYLEIPYTLRSFDRILRDPKHTIDYDEARAAAIGRRTADVGVDGQLLPGEDGRPARANLLEKLLVPALSKMCALVPGGGIWLFTQRPEWNDANNALAGYGLSVVTACSLRRYLAFCLDAIAGHDDGETVELNAEVAAWFDDTLSALTVGLSVTHDSGEPDGQRFEVMESLGRAFERFRERVEAGGLGAVSVREMRTIADFFRIAIHHIDHTIDANRRSDGLYTSYNLLVADPERRVASVDRLGEMLEGQVSALLSGRLGASASMELVDRLFAGSIHRPDQNSFMLYPVRERPPYLERGVVPPERVAPVGLMIDLLAAGETSVVVADEDGRCRFSSDLTTAQELSAALDALAGDPRWAEAVARDRDAVADAYEAVFEHRSFTGRSGTMHKYEGIGCVYWHMVSKLLLAVQERALETAAHPEPEDGFDRLARAYFQVRAGLGPNKSPAEHGAIPIEPYSHTPMHAGAQQPGMTGQVKEDILVRLGELGVRVEGGVVAFRPLLLRPAEFLEAPETWSVRLPGGETDVALDAGELGFTYCAVPIVYRRVDGGGRVIVERAGADTVELPGDTLTPELSAALWSRDGSVTRVTVEVPAAVLCGA
jgi:hypothetical protein